jgi:hypothetical protein
MLQLEISQGMHDKIKSAVEAGKCCGVKHFIERSVDARLEA